MAMYKLCAHCRRKVPYGAICECNDKVIKERYRKYKHYRKDKKEQSFYSSKGWITLRDDMRNRHKGMCVLCYSEHNIKFLDCVHHIVEIKEDYERRLDADNLICLCNKHHDYVHKKYEKSTEDRKEMQQRLFKLKQIFEDKFM